jgi:hypothetical protein
MAIAVDKSQREQAKKERKFIVQFSIDGKHADSKKLLGRMELTGCVDRESGEELIERFIALLKEKKM